MTNLSRPRIANEMQELAADLIRARENEKRRSTLAQAMAARYPQVTALLQAIATDPVRVYNTVPIRTIRAALEPETPHYAVSKCAQELGYGERQMRVEGTVYRCYVFPGGVPAPMHERRLMAAYRTPVIA